jgi:hypothetical protein
MFFYWVRDGLGERHFVETPAWAQRFVFAVDGAAPSRPITAQEALEMLERAEHPPGGARSHEGP